MAKLGLKCALGACIAGSLMASPAAGAASTAVSVPEVNPWGVLAALSGGASAAAICGSTATAAATQAPGGCVLPMLDNSPPITPATLPSAPAVPVARPAFAFTPLLFGLLALTGGAGSYLAVKNLTQANSPA